MGAQTRQIRAAYRERPMFQSDVHGTRQLLSAFVFVSALAMAMLAGANRFSHHESMQQWLRWTASIVMFLGCAGIGARLMKDAVTELRKLKQPRGNRPDLPVHLRPNRSHALVRMTIGVVIGVVVPLSILLKHVI